jgi:hypothetical protein
MITEQGHWLCALTTGPGAEGNEKQHAVVTISENAGGTWGPLITIEPQGPPESSWVTPLVVPGGRVYAFYTYNGDNLRGKLGTSMRGIYQSKAFTNYLSRHLLILPNGSSSSHWFLAMRSGHERSPGLAPRGERYSVQRTVISPRSPRRRRSMAHSFSSMCMLKTRALGGHDVIAKARRADQPSRRHYGLMCGPWPRRAPHKARTFTVCSSNV